MIKKVNDAVYIITVKNLEMTVSPLKSVHRTLMGREESSLTKIPQPEYTFPHLILDLRGAKSDGIEVSFDSKDADHCTLGGLYIIVENPKRHEDKVTKTVKKWVKSLFEYDDIMYHTDIETVLDLIETD